MFISFSVATVGLLYQIIKPDNGFLFFAIVFSIVPIHIASCYAVPDVPLLFFTTLFFYTYRSFLGQPDWKNTVFMAACCAALLYSKYHGILIIGFTVLSNPDLLRNRKFWVSFIITILLFSPHIFWQMNNDYPSLRYHLMDRNATEYSTGFILEYLVGQLLFLGPLAGGFFLYAAWKQEIHENLFLKALKFNVWGILLFFLVNSFRGRVESNWTVPIFIPLLILAYKYFYEHNKIKQWVYYIFPLSFLMILIVKIIFSLPVFEDMVMKYADMKGWKKWTEAINQQAQGRPVLFMNSYRHAAEYMFYSNRLTSSLNTAGMRASQFDFWNYGEKMCGQNVLFICNDWYYRSVEKIKTPRGELNYIDWNDYRPYYKFKIQSEEKEVRTKRGKEISLHVTTLEHFDDVKVLNECVKDEPVIYCQFVQPMHYHDPIATSLHLTSSVLNKTIPVGIIAPTEKGVYQLYFIVGNSNERLRSVNSRKVTVVID